MGHTFSCRMAISRHGAHGMPECLENENEMFL